MDFAISPALHGLRSQIAAFVARELIPLESDPGTYDPHQNISHDALTAMRAKARAENLWCLQVRPESGGRGIGRVGMAVATRK
jgi:acyl-CoA dehydrogenase